MSTRSILLVEDHKVMAEALVRILRTKGKFSIADVYILKDDVQDVMKGIRRVLKGGT